MPEHLLRVHPFVASSYLNPNRADEEEEQEIGATAEDGSDEGGSSVQLDRRRGFVVDDNSKLGTEAFLAAKSVGAASASLVGQKRATAVAVREQGTEKFAKLLRFMFPVPDSVREILNTWIAVPKQNVSFNKVLYTRRPDDGERVVDLKDILEEVINAICIPLTIGERCANWFVLRQFRLTGTNAGQMLLSSSGARSRLGIQGPGQDKTLEEWFKVLFDGWFSSKRSTEAMMRGTANEGAVLSPLRALPFVEEVFDAGLLVRRDALYLGCSPDGVAHLKKTTLPLFADSTNADTIGSENTLVLATLEIKTRIAASILGQSISISTSTPVECEVGDSTFKTYVPKEHRTQILHQLVVLGFSYAVYVAAAETGILYIVVIRCPGSVLQFCCQAVKTFAAALLQWAHEDEGTIPTFVPEELQATVASRLGFWRIINRHVTENATFLPLKLFKHSAQSFYSKTKAVVDGATQQRAILRSFTSHFK